MENEKLFVAVLGEPDSGKSKTWYELFKAPRKSGEKELVLNEYIQTEVYVFVSSPQENEWTRNEFLENFKKINEEIKIVLCSLQTHLTPSMKSKKIVSAKEVLDIARDNGYEIFIQWLNPGYKWGEDTTPDVEKYIIELMDIESLIGMTKVDAQNTPAEERAEKLRNIILGWINSR